MYTVSQKTPTQTFCDNFGKHETIFTAWIFFKTIALKLIEVDLYCRQQKCLASSLVSGDIRCMWIFAGFSSVYVNFH